jgi:hypothetical protein
LRGFDSQRLHFSLNRAVLEISFRRNDSFLRCPPANAVRSHHHVESGTASRTLAFSVVERDADGRVVGEPVDAPSELKSAKTAAT